jgi:hypothetical protein
MTPLVTIADLAAYKHIADSVKNSIVWPQFGIEAQLFDVKAWLGDALLAEIMDEAQTSPPSLSDKNKALLDGGKYTYSNRTAYFQGLRACIMYYAFGRYTSRQPFNYTAAGITVKDTDFSTPASDKATLMGASIKDEIVLYLRRNSKDYPLLKCTRTGGQARTFNVIGD